MILWNRMTLLKIYLYILWSVIIEFATLYISLPSPQSELDVVDRGGLSESNVVPKSHRRTLCSLGPSGGSPWVIRGSLCKGWLVTWPGFIKFITTFGRIPDVSAKDVLSETWRRTFRQTNMPKRLRLKTFAETFRIDVGHIRCMHARPHRRKDQLPLRSLRDLRSR